MCSVSLGCIVLFQPSAVICLESALLEEPVPSGMTIPKKHIVHCRHDREAASSGNIECILEAVVPIFSFVATFYEEYIRLYYFKRNQTRFR